MLGCEKSGGYIELYRQLEPTTSYTACLANGCISNKNGFARFIPTLTSSPNSSPIVAVPSVPAPTTQLGPMNVSTLDITSTPSGNKVKDLVEGVCRTVQYDTSSGFVQAKVCQKTTQYELYLQSGANAASVCIKGNCVGQMAGFRSFT